MNQAKAPSIIRILQNDYLAVTMTVTPLMLWLLLGVVYVLPAALGTEKLSIHPWVLAGLGLATAYCWFVLVWRTWMVRSIFGEGTLVNGVITTIWFFRQRGRCTIQYTCMGVKYETQYTLIKNARTLRLAANTRVTLVIDPQDPKRVFMRDLYL